MVVEESKVGMFIFGPETPDDMENNLNTDAIS